jgi:hypothetical protein
MTSDDDFLKRLDRLEQKAARGRASANEALNDPDAGAAPGVRGLRKGLQGIGGSFAVLASIGAAVWRFVEPVLGGAARTYRRRIWDRFAYTEDENGVRELSSKRAGGVILATVVSAFIALPLIRGVCLVSIDAVKMAFTMRTATVYLHTPDSHHDNSYSVKGCETPGICHPEDVVYYNIETSLMRHLWSLFKKRSLYVPKRIVGTISPDSDNKCEVTIYGAYYEKVSQQIGIYPELLDVTCVRADAKGDA